MTERLYYADSNLRAFDAHIVSSKTRGDQSIIELDRTAFYPTGGGQLFDTGTLSNGESLARVISVEAEDDHVWHIVDRPLIGSVVHGELDWARRCDLSQQHTGQHILSQALNELFKAETISVHMTDSNCTLDLPGHLNEQQHAEAEERANQIVQENRPVTARFVGDEELARMPLRKPPAAKHERTRIVTIEDFDWSPCGGTHMGSTGEVGLVKIIRAERRGNEQRNEFACGMRAVLDYRWKNQAIVSLSAALSVKDSDLEATVQKLVAESKENRRALNAARAQSLEREADQLWAEAPASGPLRIIEHISTSRPLEEARQIALWLKSKPATVVLLAVAGDKPNLIFGRSTDLTLDMGRLLREISAAYGGRGGGQAELAQGGVAAGSDLAVVVKSAADRIREWSTV
jgi:alanyl-tRNA synthetase